MSEAARANLRYQRLWGLTYGTYKTASFENLRVVPTLPLCGTARNLRNGVLREQHSKNDSAGKLDDIFDLAIGLRFVMLFK